MEVKKHKNRIILVTFAFWLSITHSVNDIQYLPAFTASMECKGTCELRESEPIRFMEFYMHVWYVSWHVCSVYELISMIQFYVQLLKFQIKVLCVHIAFIII